MPSESTWNNRWQRWRQEEDAPLPLAWWVGKDDILRHSYGTYRAAILRNSHNLAEEMGNCWKMKFLVQLLRPWSGNLGQRSIRTPKVYLNDTGLLAHLLALSQERLETDPSLAGALAENFVMMELVKQSAWSETTPKIFYWRTASGREVDVVLEDSAERLWVMK
jgi:predicted AAA+ superfamily ATPase